MQTKKIGMFKTAIERFDIDVEKTIAIGDEMRDLTILLIKNALKAGVKAYTSLWTLGLQLSQ